ncbi:hypothetical protein SUGI_0063800 [Cryptomeria japonica]|uniref:probable methyltransferase PMT17 n=1 Tax=Cryptomeria japonica TaxID=3369 RepID=UPI00240897C9|nr:probable methyltransferase PMT17 [Cryptomeria japonica]XP_059075043.1 probable methyltransferase PMT17 [Cryptomeria japonica]GLJ07296.1 hypothetical protein SUGI_0063800 [Cryptomeria japonica]
MARERSATPSKLYQEGFQKKNLTWVFGVSVLCTFFYFLGMWKNTSVLNTAAVKLAFSQVIPCRSPSNPPKPEFVYLDFEAHHLGVAPLDNASESEIPIMLKPCDMQYSEYTPCEDIERSRKFDNHRSFFRERHCPEKNELFRCLIPDPPGYRTPFRWPQSMDFAWYANVPHKELTVSKADQNWIKFQEDRFRFPGGGTSFPNGAKRYIEAIGKLIPLTDGSVRTALDTGCGVASWGAYLFKYKILTMSFAPKDIHEAQVQFALERGVPAMIGILGTRRLPYPARAFDMAHCSRCLIPWTDYDGAFLIEIDRVLRPGGYWVLSGPPINWKNHHKGWERTEASLKQEQEAIEDLAKRLCWKKIAEKGDLAVWQKPTNHIHCIKKRKIFKVPPFCQGGNPDTAWYQKMETCITPLPTVKNIEETAGLAVEKWPKRLTAVPPRVKRSTITGVTTQTFNQDTRLWTKRLIYYRRFIESITDGKYRNIMDMNAGLGGFAAALADYPVWVMNVVPPDAKNNTLGTIYERGLIGTYLDWCEAFSTYPRTYDLIHADGIFSMYQDRCDIIDILLEMDRIVRPEGAVIIRDHVDVLVKVKKITDSMSWESHLAHNERGPFSVEKILFVNSTRLANSYQALYSR